MNSHRQHLQIPQIIIWGSTALALTILFTSWLCGDESESVEDTMEGTTIGVGVAIVVAVIGAAAGIWTQILQFKNNRPLGEHIEQTTESVKQDTVEIKPIIVNTNENVKKIRDDVVEKLVPHMRRLDGVDQLVEEMRYQKRVKEDSSRALVNQDDIVNGIARLYEINARLNVQLSEATRREQELTQEVQNLQAELALREEQLSRYTTLEPPHIDDPGRDLNGPRLGL